jgi:hypothetical protein
MFRSGLVIPENLVRARDEVSQLGTESAATRCYELDLLEVELLELLDKRDLLVTLLNLTAGSISLNLEERQPAIHPLLLLFILIDLAGQFLNKLTGHLPCRPILCNLANQILPIFIVFR